MKAYFVSDIHITNMGDEKAQIFLHFLKNLDPDCTHLFLMGDIFDIWINHHNYYIKKFKPIVDQLLTLKEKGVDIHYFEGNHDFILKKFWEDELHMSVHPEPIQLKLGHYQVRLEHGDAMNPEDKSYARLRWFLRSTLMRTATTYAPGTWVGFVGENWSRLSRKKKRVYVNEKVRARARQYAEEMFAKNKFDLLISGHIHMRDQYSVAGGHAEYINLGTWLDRPSVFVLSDQERKFIDL